MKLAKRMSRLGTETAFEVLARAGELEAQGRHPYRPAHVHFMIEAPGFQKLVTHVFADGDTYLDSDVVFGVKNSLIREYEMHEPGKAPDGRDMTEPYAYLHYDFRLKRV